MEAAGTQYGEPPPLASRVIERWCNQLQFRDTIQSPTITDARHEHEEEAASPMKADTKPTLRHGTGFTLEDLRLRGGGYLSQSDFVASLKEKSNSTQVGNVLTIGGIRAQNTALVMDAGQGRFADVPVVIIGSPAAQLGLGTLVMSKAVTEQGVQTAALVFSNTFADAAPASSLSTPEVPGRPAAHSVYEDGISLTFPASSYILKGNVQALFGIKGLDAQIYRYQSDVQNAPAKEQVKFVTSVGLRWNRFVLSMPFYQFRDLTPTSLNFFYDEVNAEEVEGWTQFDQGLRVEADFDFEGRLQPIADVLHMLFGNDPRQEIPSSIRLSAQLSHNGSDRWSKSPKVSSASLAGSVKMSLWLTEFLEFTELGVFLQTSGQVKNKDRNYKAPGSKKREAEEPESDRGKSDKRRRLDDLLRYQDSSEPLEPRALTDAANTGDAQAALNKGGISFGIFGEVNIHHLPGAALPLDARYNITRRWVDEKKLSQSVDNPGYWQTEFLAVVDRWQKAFGFEPVEMHSIKLDMSWREMDGKKQESAISIHAKLEIGNLELEVSGCYLGGDTYVEGHLERLRWDDVVRIYRWLFGNDAQPGTDGNQFSFTEVKLMINKKGFSLECALEFNDFKAASASISFGEDGLQIQSELQWERIDNGKDVFKGYTIPGTSITLNNAYLNIEIGRRLEHKDDGKRRSRLSTITVKKLDGSIEKVSDEDTRRDGRKTRFAISGEIDFAGVVITAGLVYSNTGRRRQWVVYGELGNVIKTSNLAPQIKGTWLDVELSDLAIVASSHELTGSSRGNIPLHYPISKGLNLCATLAPVTQISHLSGDKNATVGGVGFVACISSTGLEMSLHMPQNFVAHLSSAAQIRHFRIAVKISKVPALAVGGDLYLALEGQRDPLVFKIDLIADILGLTGSIRCDSVWKNPFGISDKVEITEMAGDLGFLYAGAPYKFGVAAQGQAGPVKAGVAFSIGVLPDQQVVGFNLDDLHIGPILELIGDVHDIQALRDCGRADFLVFVKAQLYFSTGGTIAQKVYPAGMSASGTVKLFGKTASFEAEVGTNGFLFLGSIDAFELGPLAIRAADGGDQAKLEIVATRNEQRLLVNGMISFLGLHLKVFIKASLRPFDLDVSISINLGDILTFDLEASVKNVQRGSARHYQIHFFAELKLDILGKFCDAAINFFDDLRKAADENIDKMENKLESMQMDVERRLSAAEAEVRAWEEQMAAARAVRDEECARQEAEARKAQEKYNALKKAVDDAKHWQKEAEEEAENKLRRMEERLAEKKRAKLQEYNRELRIAEDNKRKYQEQLTEAENRKRVDFGQAIRDLEAAKKDVARLQDNYNWHHQRMNDLIRWRDETWDPFAKAQKFFEIEGMRVARDAIGTSMDIANGALLASQIIVGSAKFIGLEQTINDTADGFAVAAAAFESLVKEGPEAFVEKLVKNELTELARQKQYLRDVVINATEHARAVRAAIHELKVATGPGLLMVIAQCDRAIAIARDNLQLQNLQASFDRVKTEKRMLDEKAANLVHTLEIIRDGVHVTTDVLTGIAVAVKIVVPRITRVTVEVDAGDLKKGNRFRFEVEATFALRTATLVIFWGPQDSPQDLFAEMSRQAAGI